MSSIFTKIINGDLPGTFVWKDEAVVAFLSIAPLVPGHTLVVTRREIDQWTDAPTELLIRCTQVAQAIGLAVKHAFQAPRAGLIVAGFEIPHTHLHVFPAWHMGNFDFSAARPLDDPAALSGPAEAIRLSLRGLGFGEHVAR